MWIATQHSDTVHHVNLRMLPAKPTELLQSRRMWMGLPGGYRGKSLVGSFGWLGNITYAGIDRDDLGVVKQFSGDEKAWVDPNT
jgi:hypothetical protein